jgi:hypothetical protein
MGTRGLLNLVLVVVALGMGLVIYFEPGLEPADTPQPLGTQLTPDEAIGIHIERVKYDPLSFIKRNERWYLMTEQQELPASKFQVQALLRLLETSSSSRYAADTVNLESLGLEPPQATVTIDDVVILFGNTAPLDGKRYAQIDATVYLIEDNYQHLINAGWANFVERKLLPADKSIRTLRLPDMTLTFTDKDQWQLSPDKPGISADAIQQLLDRWNKVNALYARRYDDRTSDEIITVEFSDSPETLTFMIIAHSPELVLARPDWGIQYHLSSNVEETLLTLQEPEQDRSPD